MCNGTPFAVEKISPRVRIELTSSEDRTRFAGSVGKRLTHLATGAPISTREWNCVFSRRAKALHVKITISLMRRGKTDQVYAHTNLSISCSCMLKVPF